MITISKSTGLGWTTLDVDDATNSATDIRNDVTELQFSTPRAVQEVTGLDKSAIERLLLLADFSMTPKGVFNPAVSHTVFSTVPSTSVNRAVSMTVDAASLNLTGVLFTDYQIDRTNTGELNWTAPGVLADGATPTWS